MTLNSTGLDSIGSAMELFALLVHYHGQYVSWLDLLPFHGQHAQNDDSFKIINYLLKYNIEIVSTLSCPQSMPALSQLNVCSLGRSGSKSAYIRCRQMQDDVVPVSDAQQSVLFIDLLSYFLLGENFVWVVHL